jgi:hypothetical protein
MSRLYFDKDVSELESVVEKLWGDAEKLASVLVELKQRTTRAAMQLQKKVEARLDEIRSARQKSNGGSGTSSDATAALEAKLRDAGARMRALEGLVALWKARAEEAERHTRQPQMASTQALYARVGLAPGCPDLVFNVVRRAFLKEHHPDRYPSSAEKRQAEERFRQFDMVFDQIAALRR